MKAEDIKSMLTASLYFLSAAFLLIFFFFYKSGPVKVIFITLAYFFIIHMPGLLLVNILREHDKMNSFLAPAFGIINLAIWAYLFGSLGIHLKLSLIISLGIPYSWFIYKVYKSGILNNYENLVGEKQPKESLEKHSVKEESDGK